MPDHLLRRSGVFYYHRRVPLAAVSVIGKKIITFSLGTTDPKVAKKKRDLEDVRWNAKFEAAEASISKSPQDAAPTARTGLIQLVQDYVERTDERSRTLLLADPPKIMAEKEEIKIDAEVGRQIIKDIDDPNGAAWIHSTVEKITGNSPSEITDIFGEIVRRGLLELKNRQIARLDDDFSRPFFDPLFAPRAKNPAPTFGQVANQFIAITDESAKANGSSVKWVDKQRANVALLKEIVGQGTSITEVDFDACMRVRTALAAIPANRAKVYGSKPLSQAIEQAKYQGKALLSPVTQDQYLATFRAILNLAAKKRLIATSPATDLKPLRRDRVSASDKRLPLTPLQLRQIFEGAFYKTCAEQASPPYSFDKAGWRFWMPLIALFMGLRPNEICQLAASDVRCTEAGTWFVNVVASEDEGESAAKRLKTPSSRRRVPVHPELIQMGFVEYAVERQKLGVLDRLFPELQPDRYGNYAKYPLKRFRELYLPEATTLDKRQTFYSLRHNFRDALRRADAPPDALQVLGGWSQGGRVSDQYGEKDNPDYQIRFMRKVSYPGLNLTILHSQISGGTSENPAPE